MSHTISMNLNDAIFILDDFVQNNLSNSDTRGALTTLLNQIAAQKKRGLTEKEVEAFVVNHSIDNYSDLPDYLLAFQKEIMAAQDGHITSGCSSTLPPQSISCGHHKEHSICLMGANGECGINACIIHLANYKQYPCGRSGD